MYKTLLKTFFLKTKNYYDLDDISGRFFRLCSAKSKMPSNRLHQECLSFILRLHMNIQIANKPIFCSNRFKTDRIQSVFSVQLNSWKSIPNFPLLCSTLKKECITNLSVFFSKPFPLTFSVQFETFNIHCHKIRKFWNKNTIDEWISISLQK